MPPVNVTISNVPGIRQPMYWNGARMDGSYPLSIITDGMAMNITLVTYDKNVDFGIIACRRSVPQVQRMIEYMEDALQELEDAAGFASQSTSRKAAKVKKTPAKGSPETNTKTNTKTKAKAKAKAKAKTATKPKTKAPAKSKAAAQSKTGTRAKSQAKARAKIATKAKPKARARPKAKTKAAPRKSAKKAPTKARPKSAAGRG